MPRQVNHRRRHSGTEDETTCGALYAADVVDNDRPNCWPCWIRRSFRAGKTLSNITTTLVASFGETPEVQGAYVERVLQHGHPSR